ncbi:hypothetical protein [Krasilnikovia sp. MM14-A1259]|uniref:hypothetical protein n=1 Tax=Krasilnikovia sp. MM14-A1259 TaxID=3373539 RepID=UPI00380DA6DF
MSTIPLTRVGAGPAPEESAPAGPAPKRRAVPATVLIFAAALTAVWSVVALRAAGRGFDVTDEGFYLLSYRWWNSDHRSFTGVQYLYGPVFALLGHDIAGLRTVRLGTVLIAHLVFGVEFMRWLRPRRPHAPATRLWEAAGAAAIVAAGGAVYAWPPQTPGYNDVVLVGALLATAVVFAMARHAERGDRVPVWLPVAFGVLVVPVLLAKWAALALLGLIAGAAAVALAPGRVRALLRAAGAALAGAAAATVAFHVLVVPLTTALPPIIAVNRLMAQNSFAIPTLLARYVRETRPTVETVAHVYAILLVAMVAATLIRRPVAQAVAAVLGVAGLAVAVQHTVRDGGLGGGPVNSGKFLVPMLAALLTALVAGGAGLVRDRRAAVQRAAGASDPLPAGTRPATPGPVAGRRDDRCPAARPGLRAGVLLGTLVVLPLGYAFGTSNPPLKVAVLAFGAWMAILVAVVTGLDRRAPAARGLMAAVAAGALLVSTCLAIGGLWRNPYLTERLDRATAAVPGVPALDGVRIEPAQARAYADLRARLGPYLTPPGRKVIGLDMIAGVVLLLGGRSVGEFWYSANDPARIRAGIAAECADGPPWPAGRAPILVLTRPVRATDADLIAPCGLQLPDYRQLAPPVETGGFTVLVPR